MMRFERADGKNAAVARHREVDAKEGLMLRQALVCGMMPQAVPTACDAVGSDKAAKEASLRRCLSDAANHVCRGLTSAPLIFCDTASPS